jgi:cysteine desulfurase
VAAPGAVPDGYFDAAAGLPLHPVAVQALNAALEDGWADPSRLTGPGRRSAVLLEAAREAAAAELGVRPDELTFTPSGSHALQQAVLGGLAGRRRAGNRLVHSAVEHSTVFKAADWHLARGGQVQVVPVDGLGRVDAAGFAAAAGAPGTAVAVLQAANHEVGTRQPLDGLDTGRTPLIVDAGHQLVYGEAPERADIFTADPRLWGGPAGLGLLVVRRTARWRPPFPVDESERGHGLGAPNVPAAVAAAASLRATRAERQAHADRLSGYIDQLRRRVPELVPDSVVFGPDRDRLPHLVTFSCLYVDGETLLTELDRHGFSVSSGSSCTSDTLTPSHVLVAMGALTSGNVRVSLHPGVAQADIDRFLALLPAAVARVRAQAPGSPAPAVAAPHPTGRTPADPGWDAVAERVVDSRGRRCPLPVLDLARALPQVAIGDQVTVLADDPAAAGDLAAWCRMTGQLLLMTEADGSYRVRRVH